MCGPKIGSSKQMASKLLSFCVCETLCLFNSGVQSTADGHVLWGVNHCIQSISALGQKTGFGQFLICVLTLHKLFCLEFTVLIFIKLIYPLIILPVVVFPRWKELDTCHSCHSQVPRKHSFFSHSLIHPLLLLCSEHSESRIWGQPAWFRAQGLTFLCLL